jgi:hypothetical protein
MPISDVYVARQSSLAIATTAATQVLSLFGTAAKRIWIVGCRVEIVNAGATPAGNSMLFQLVRVSSTVSGTAPAAGYAQDFSAPASLGSFATAWGTAPTFSNSTAVLAEWTIPQTTGSAWEEFPPLGYEWGVPATANNANNAGVHLFVTASNNTSTTVTADLIWSE